jgi:hypothetical protein
MATYQIINLETGEFSTGTLDEAATLAALDPHEIEWAIEEHGVCETGVFQITKLSDPPEYGHSHGDQPEDDDGDPGDAENRFLTPVFVFISREEFEAHLAEHPAAVIRLRWDEPIVRGAVEAQRDTVAKQLGTDASGEPAEPSAVYHLTRETIALIK